MKSISNSLHFLAKNFRPSSTIGQRKLHTTFDCRAATIMDGRAVAGRLLAEVADDVAALVQGGAPPPHLALVRLGDDPASAVYVRNKQRAAQKVGITSTVHHLPLATSQHQLLRQLKDLNADAGVSGVLVQLPLPEHIEEKTVCSAVSPAKDVDGFHEVNFGRFAQDLPCLGPCTPLGVLELIRRYNIPTLGKRAVVVGRSKNVGLPIAMLLHGDGQRSDAATGGLDCTTTILHRFSPATDLKHYLATADIIVAAAGVPGLIHGRDLKPGCCVVDVAINRVSDGAGRTKLVGDCDWPSVLEVAGHATPVPGGVGPMTVALLLSNTLKAAKAQRA